MEIFIQKGFEFNSIYHGFILTKHNYYKFMRVAQVCEVGIIK